MPIYDFRCDQCGSITEGWDTAESARTQDTCDKCGGTIRRLIPAPAGITSDRAGRGRRHHELVFDRPDPAKDIPETLRRMEESGYFQKHPDALESAMVKAEEAKTMISNPVDYQKVGHPLERTD